MILVVIILFIFLGNVRGALIVSLTIPFALLFASICLDLRHISANLLSLGALDFGMVVDGAVVMVENIVRHLNRPRRRSPDSARADPRSGARSAAAGVLCDRHHHHGVSADFHACSEWKESCSSRWPGRSAFALLGALIFSMLIAPALASFLFSAGVKEWKNPVMTYLDRPLSDGLDVGDPAPFGCIGGARWCFSCCRYSWPSAE